jgi:single-stranded-DNA-specific exonuclease
MASGVGIVYKFLQALDEKIGAEESDKYLDLVALGEISDMMWMQTPENRFICDYGLSHINNEFFRTVVKKQCYSMFGIYEDAWTDSYYTNGDVT